MMVFRYYSFSQWPHAGQIWGFLRSVWMVSEDVRQMIRNPHSHTCLEIISISEAIGFSPGQTRGLGLGWKAHFRLRTGAILNVWAGLWKQISMNIKMSQSDGNFDILKSHVRGLRVDLLAFTFCQFHMIIHNTWQQPARRLGNWKRCSL